MDKICLKGMAFYAYHGVMPEEKQIGQKFLIDCTVYLDLSAAANSDAISDTVDYAKIYNIVQSISENKKFDLIERLAGTVNKAILAVFPQILIIETTVHKPAAPLAGIFSDVSVTVREER